MDGVTVITNPTVSVRVTSTANSFEALRRFNRGITIAEFKCKLELVVGIQASCMDLQLFSSTDTFLQKLDDNEALMGSYPVDDNCKIHCLTHLDARSSVPDSVLDAPRRSKLGAQRSVHVPRRSARRRLDARCTYLDARRFGASTLGARTSVHGGHDGTAIPPHDPSECGASGPRVTNGAHRWSACGSSTSASRPTAGGVGRRCVARDASDAEPLFEEGTEPEVTSQHSEQDDPEVLDTNDPMWSVVERAARHLGVDWPASEPTRRSLFELLSAQHLQSRILPAFPDFIKEVQSTWGAPASTPATFRKASAFTMHGASEAGLASFPPVGAAFAALVKAPTLSGLAKDPSCPNRQCRITEAYLKKGYAAATEAVRLSNVASLLTVYQATLLRGLPECPSAALRTELGTIAQLLVKLAQLNARALGRSIASLVVARGQLWLSQARVIDKSGSQSGVFEDLSAVEKFELPDEVYDKRSESVRSFLKKNKAGRFNEEKAAQKEELQAQRDAEEKLLAEALSPGLRCEVQVVGQPTRRGTVMYVGNTEFKPGYWVGVKYDEPLGKHDGSVNGKQYFECQHKYGAFVKPQYVTVGDFPEEDYGLNDEM
ncbi:UNVERIFIED_CONTAM: hypothetical protein FKN15_004053 [Acipenser sinensis]